MLLFKIIKVAASLVYSVFIIMSSIILKKIFYFYHKIFSFSYYFYNLFIQEKVWWNTTPQSYRLCRPLNCAVEKEDEEAIIDEYNRVVKEKLSLTPSHFILASGKSVTADYRVLTTMYDQKGVNCLVAKKDPKACTMCGVDNAHFSKKSNLFPIIDDRFQFRLGPLYCHTKAMEHLFNVFYYLVPEIMGRGRNFRNITDTVKGK